MSPPDVSRPGTREVWLVAALTMAALVLRAWQLQRVGLSQFDEGVYALSGLGLIDPSQPHRLFPDQQKFSPPVYFSLVALSDLLQGPSDRAAILVNVVMGTLMVPAIWMVSRRWIGGAAAVVAAALVAFNDGHILMSRVALTDVTFALVFVVAVGAVAMALENPSRGRAISAGVLVGLSWNTKYHGWFALVIGAMAVAAKWRFERVPWVALRPQLRAGLVMSAVAVLCYLPWLLFIQAGSGATAGWAAYFATMLRINWVGNLLQHAHQQWLLEGLWSRMSVAIAVALAMVVDRRLRAHGVAPVIGMSLGGAVLGASAVGVAAAGLVLWRLRQAGGSYFLWCFGSLVVLWVVMAPLYQPYFRLLVPFTMATFILTGQVIVATAPAPATTTRGWVAMAGLGLAALVGVAMPAPTSPWRSARAMADAASRIASRLAPGSPVTVIGEPPLAFYLHTAGHASFERGVTKTIEASSVPVNVVTGFYARRAPVLERWLADHASQLEPLGRFPVDPTDLRLIDDYGPDRALAYRARPDTMYDLVLYRYRPLGDRSAR